MTHNCYHPKGETCALCSGAFARVVCAQETLTKQTFERCADTAISEVRAIFAQRGADYADTWSEENAAAHFTREAEKALRGDTSTRAIQLRHLAALIDVKISRMTGGYKSDTVADLVAYLCCYKTMREEYGAR